jgi:hypothetical protein
MDNKKLYYEINKLTTTELLIVKMECSESASVFDMMIKISFTFVAYFLSLITKDILDGVKTADLSVSYALFAFVSFVITLVFVLLKSREIVTKELIVDILTIRGNRTGKSFKSNSLTKTDTKSKNKGSSLK